MAIKDEAPQLAAYIEDNKARLHHSHELLCIYENDLLKFIDEMFQKEMSQNTYKEIITRIPPINVLIKIVDKLSRIYQEGVVRRVIEGSDQDQELLEWYIEQFNADHKFNQGNEFYNLDRINLMQPFFDEENGKPSLRAVPNDRYLPYSTNAFDPTIPTHIIIHAGKRLVKTDSKGLRNPRGRSNKSVDVYWVWTAEEIVLIDQDGVVQRDEMTAKGFDGLNPFGVLPFAYINSSQNFLLPPSDSDTKQMTVLIPALMADLNYSSKYQSFSQLVAFNWDNANPTFAPNAVHYVNDDPNNPDSKASMEVIKPSVDITEVAKWIVTQLSMWLNSRGIKPGTMGDLSADNLASGVSKMIDEMDTAENRQKQAAVYSRAEERFWDTVLNHMHPYWVSQGLVENRHLFTGDGVQVEFPPQTPMIDRKQLVETAVMEIQNGLRSVETVIQDLNPRWEQERIDEELLRIEGEAPEPEPMPDPTEETDDDVEGEQPDTEE